MASASVRTMTLGQNIHMMPNNCVIVSANMISGKSQQMYSSHGKRPIVPAPTVLTSNGGNQVINIPKKKYNYGSMQYPSNQTASVARRNARERNRVKQVNNGFSNLRQHIPQTVITALTKGGRGSSKKLSKVDTLKLAVEYIRSLKDMLDENENSASGSSTSSYYSENSQHLQSLSRSEASLSPTPSYSSDASSTLSYTPNHIQSHQTHFKQEPFDSYVDPSTSPAPSYHSDIQIHHQQIFPPTSTPYKPVHQYDNYSPVSPEDEDLLDAITWWQQQ
ncbi:CLUMA_CG006467, isoform A [Clunio marinus]|uniref:CLUMA_CG006467, isoform A n=1 Tax=Clunio marinus TaxID=568069 RepID=A0A1J1HYM6_9DIPT|nr:CLUMA_CG006467, isoform A [Clunio marinus]